MFYQFGSTIPCSATYSLKVCARLSLKVATKGSISGKKNLKIYIFRLFLKEKTEKSDQKVGNVFDQFGIAIPCSATYFLKVSARLSLKVATKGSISGKKNLKIYIFRLFLKEKTEKSDQKVGNVFDQFGIAIPCLATYFLKVSARLSLKVATKGSIRGRKNSEN